MSAVFVARLTGSLTPRVGGGIALLGRGDNLSTPADEQQRGEMGREIVNPANSKLTKIELVELAGSWKGDEADSQALCLDSGHGVRRMRLSVTRKQAKDALLPA